MRNFSIAILFSMAIVFSALAWQKKSDFDISINDTDGDGKAEILEKGSLEFLGSLLIAGFATITAVSLLKNKVEIHV